MLNHVGDASTSTATPSNSSSTASNSTAQSSGNNQESMSQDDWSRRNCLFIAALSGDYDTAKKIISTNQNHGILKEDILNSGRMETVLHVAAGANQTEFVKQLLRDFGNNIDVSLKDINGNTAFFTACAAGEFEIVKELLAMESRRTIEFLTTSNGEGVSPFSIAVSFGHGEVASLLYKETNRTNPNYFSNDLEQGHRYGIFFSCINNDLYALALTLLADNRFTEGVQRARDHEDGQTALHLLSRKPPSVFATPKTHGSVFSKLFGQSSVPEESKALKLVKELWNRTLKEKNYEFLEIRSVIQAPFHLLMEAAKVGNHDFLVVIFSAYPELIWENYEGKTIFNFAVNYRQVEIFKLIHEIGLSKQLVQNYEDNRQNNLLHLAALKPPESRLRSIVGSALQMREQILWFQEVKKIVIPSFRNKMNSNGQTPHDLFTKKHNTLMKESEKWMKKNANICLLVTTIIVTVIFQANSDISGDGKAYAKSPIVKHILLVSNSIAMCTSSISLMLNLFIIISRFSEDDLLRPLPFAFIGGIVSLYISIAFMMTSFCLASFVATESLAIQICTCLLEFLPVILFPCLVYPIFHDLNVSTFFSESKFKPGKRVLRCSYEIEENVRRVNGGAIELQAVTVAQPRS